MLGGRDWQLVRRNVLAPDNWRALARAPGCYARPLAFSYSYFSGGGAYPVECELRTPLGRIAPTLYSWHDLLTVNEIFVRRDYAATATDRVVVDIGSNIGISALWFLTRGPDVRVYGAEPVPENIARLRHNLAPFDGRWELREVAVAPRGGPVVFGTEPFGRYGGIGVNGTATLELEAVALGDLLADVLEREPRIDVLKVDIEGLERAAIAAIPPEVLDRIAVIYYEECGTAAPPHPERFDAHRAVDTIRMVNRAGARAPVSRRFRFSRSPSSADPRRTAV